ncbi:MAG: hypothetical protein KF832_03250 [Caldilineaceae bacterium]|nr:hypothetical protein [Caldilineaceae bacterium]
MFDLVLSDISRARYEDLLREGAEERRALTVAQSQGSHWAEHALGYVGQRLIDTGVRLKARAEIHPSLSQR